MKKLILLIVLIGLLFGCAGQERVRTEVSGYQPSTLHDKIMHKSKLRVGLSAFIPWSFQDKNGEWVGFEVDVAKQLAKDMGVKIEFVPTKWESLIPSLLAGKFDLIIAGMTRTPERALKINFTIPYDYKYMNVVAHKNFAAGVTDYMDLDKKGNTIIATSYRVSAVGSSCAILAKKTYKNAKVSLFPNQRAIIQELLSGKATAMLGLGATASPVGCQIS